MDRRAWALCLWVAGCGSTTPAERRHFDELRARLERDARESELRHARREMNQRRWSRAYAIAAAHLRSPRAHPDVVPELRRLAEKAWREVLAQSRSQEALPTLLALGRELAAGPPPASLHAETREVVARLVDKSLDTLPREAADRSRAITDAQIPPEWLPADFGARAERLRLAEVKMDRAGDELRALHARQAALETPHHPATAALLHESSGNPTAAEQVAARVGPGVDLQVSGPAECEPVLAALRRALPPDPGQPPLRVELRSCARETETRRERGFASSGSGPTVSQHYEAGRLDASGNWVTGGVVRTVTVAPTEPAPAGPAWVTAEREVLRCVGHVASDAKATPFDVGGAGPWPEERSTEAPAASDQCAARIRTETLAAAHALALDAILARARQAAAGGHDAEATELYATALIRHRRHFPDAPPPSDAVSWLSARQLGPGATRRR